MAQKKLEKALKELFDRLEAAKRPEKVRWVCPTCKRPA